LGKVIERLLLFVACLLAAYQVAVGIDGLGTFVVTSYTIGFGVLLISLLMMVILGFDILGSPLVVIISTIIPLGISMGLVAEYLPGASSMYLIYVILGLAAVVWTRLNSEGSLPVQILVVVHGVSGLTIFGLPLVFSLAGVTPPGFLFFSLGGALMGLAGILLSALRAGKPIISQTKILTALPVVLLLVSAAFVAGFALG
jgi:hypothetical protein